MSTRVLRAFSLASHCEVRGSEAELALCCQCNRHTPDAVWKCFPCQLVPFCGESRWCVPGRHCLLLERVTFHGSLCSKRFRSPVHLERHGHELMRSMLTHWSESSYHGCMLLVFPNDSAHSFFWRGMDVKTAEASIVIS